MRGAVHGQRLSAFSGEVMPRSAHEHLLSATLTGRGLAAYRPPLMRLRPLALSLGAALLGSLCSLGPLGCGERGEPAAAPSSTASPASARAESPRGTADAAEPSAEPAAKAESAAGAAPSAGVDRGKAKPSSDPGSAPARADQDDKRHDGDTPAAPPPAGEARGDHFADLETLCAALNRDYVDGTLTDYYHDLTLKTEFGAELRRRGEDSMKPGRILEAGRKKLGERPSGDPPTPACDQLFDELDDLE